MSKKWFSVDEMLPKEYVPVLTITDYGKMDVCYRAANEHGGFYWHNAMRSQHTNGSVTHWQKLPNPPFFLTKRAADLPDGPLCICGKPISKHQGVVCLPESANR